MSSTGNEDEPLPDGWVLCQSKSNPGRKYYFNKKTGKSSWTRPEDVVKSASSVKKMKKEKDERQEKNRNEVHKINLKRKSDGHHEESSPKKKVIRVTELHTPDSSKSKSQKASPQSRSTPAKNSANKRLAMLRARLSEEAQREDSSETSTNQMKSPPTPKRETSKITPKVIQTESTPKSNHRMSTSELKSPILSDPKCSTSTQSPSSDSLNSVPSPSQFFTASKIITSMKAQLPEEYSCKIKNKNTFADIEQEISSLTPDYQFIKHPSTPPQFSEASKIVSAIKSKLAYRCPTSREITDVPVFATAKDRLESLRSSLGNENNETKESDTLSISCNIPVLQRQQSTEAMEVEDIKLIQSSSSSHTQSLQKSSIDNSRDDVVLVVDTNIFIHELDMIKNVLNSHIKGYSKQPTLLVPWRVVNELDRLKDNNGNGALCKRARAAMDYLYQSIPENNRIKGQSLRDANSHIYPCEVPDDEILNCCLQQAERGKSVILLSNDKNLCTKAQINSVRSIALSELEAQLERRPTSCDPEMEENLRHYENSIYQLLANILENEMRAKYDNLWKHVLFKAPPWSLHDVLQCLLKHWLAVFNEVFPRIEHLITELKYVMQRIEGHKSLTLAEVDNFKDLALEVARKCQIIPEYMELAKQTVERLSKKEQSHVVNSTHDDMVVVDAFENVWTVFSSYCAKLATGLGVAHNLDDKISSHDSVAELTAKWPIFSKQIRSFTEALYGVLSTSEDSSPSATGIARLEDVFRDSLRLVACDENLVTKHNLTLFSTKCKEMLREAHTKFQQLTELLGVCSAAMSTK